MTFEKDTIKYDSKNNFIIMKTYRDASAERMIQALLLNNTSKQYVEPTNVTNPISSGPPIHITGWNKILATGHAIRFLE